MPDTQIPKPPKAEKLDATRLPHGEKNLTPLAQLRRLQRILFERASSKDVEDKVLSSIACAWEKLEGRKAILTMRPAPRPVEVPFRRTNRKRRGQVAQDHSPDAPSSIVPLPGNPQASDPPASGQVPGAQQ